MKIAVLLFGHLRDFENCYTTLKECVIDIYDCDLFIHTWDVTEPSTASWHKQRTVSKNVDETIKKQIVDYYSPCDFMIEHQYKYDKELVVNSNKNPGFSFSTAGLYYMFYSMNKANTLRKQYEKKNYKQYDLVLATRPDVRFNSLLNIQRIIEQSEILGLDLEKIRYYASQLSTSKDMNALYINEPNDLLFFGKPNIIDLYIEVNRNIPNEYIEEHAINIVSVFTARELETGIIPIPISYTMGKDWSFSGSRSKSRLFGMNRPWYVKLILSIIVSVLSPIFKLYKKYPWLNKYE